MKAFAIKLTLFFYLTFSAGIVAILKPRLETPNDLEISAKEYFDGKLSKEMLIEKIRGEALKKIQFKNTTPIELTDEILVEAQKSVESLSDFFTEKLAQIFSKIYLDSEAFYKYSDEEMKKEAPESIIKIKELDEQFQKLDCKIFNNLLKSINIIYEHLRKEPENIVEYNQWNYIIPRILESINYQKTILCEFLKACISWLDSAKLEAKGLIENEDSFENNIESLKNSNETFLSLFKTNQNQEKKSLQKEEKIYIFKAHFFRKTISHLTELTVDQYSYSFYFKRSLQNWKSYEDFRLQILPIRDFYCHFYFPFNQISKYIIVWRQIFMQFEQFDFSKNLFSKVFEANKFGLENFIVLANSYNLVKVED